MDNLDNSTTYSDINGNLYSILDVWNFTENDDIEMNIKSAIIFSYFYRYMTFMSQTQTDLHILLLFL